MTKLKIQPPERFTGIKISEPAKVAAGIKGIVVAGKHVYDEMGVSGVGTLFRINQFKGFDCPGCAWPDHDDKRSPIAEYCENGAKAVAEEATKKQADPKFFAKHSIEELNGWTDYEIGKSGRIMHPMLIEEGEDHYKAISWEEAFSIISEELNKLNSPHEAIFYTSGRTSNEAAFLYQLFVRQYGTNNLPDCSNMCHESSGAALGMTLGLGKGSVTLDDFAHSEVIMIIGQNPGTNHPRMLITLEEAKRKGAKIVAVNPLKEPGLVKFKNPQGTSMINSTQLSDIYLQVKINQDVALLKALMIILLEKEKQDGGVLDHDFISGHTKGWDELKADLESQNLDELIAATGLDSADIHETAELLAKKERIIICWAMGVTQHKNAVGNIQEIVNLLLMKGSIGKKGAGTCPVRGHSNVQGDRTVGIWERPKPEFLDNLQKHFDFEPPRDFGYDSVESIEAMAEGKAKVFFSMGGNFLSATPDTPLTAKGLQQCELTVHVSTKPNRSHLAHGKRSLILPCLGRTELDIQNGQKQFVSVENSMGVVHQSNGTNKPASKHLKSEVRIICDLAQEVFKDKSSITWSSYANDYDLIRNDIEAVIPGFENYNIRVRERGGFYLPNGPRERRFTTKDEKAHFTINAVSDLKLETGQYLMTTIRSHDQFNTTIYGLDDRYRGIFNERRVVMMNRQDMKKAGLKEKDVVNLQSHFQGEVREVRKFLVVPYDIPRQCVATYFPEANPLVQVKNKADISNTPASKSVVISISK